MTRTVLGGILIVAFVLAGAGCKQISAPDKRTEWAPDVRLATVMAPTQAPRQSAVSPDQVRQALIVPTPEAVDREVEHVYLKAGGRDYVILGLPYEGKGIENLHWQDAGTLVFERWYAADRGIRFFIDVRRGVLGQATSIRR